MNDKLGRMQKEVLVTYFYTLTQNVIIETEKTQLVRYVDGYAGQGVEL